MPSAERSPGELPEAQPLNPEDDRLPEDLRTLLRHARSSWLPNTAVLSLLTCHRSCGLEVDREPPSAPAGKRMLSDSEKAMVPKTTGLKFKEYFQVSCWSIDLSTI